MPGTGVIYGLADSDGIFYIGRANDPTRRLKDHRRERTGRAVERMVILELGVPVGRLHARECALIALFTDAGIRLENKNPGGAGVVSHSPETRARMSAAQKGRRMSAEARANMSAAQKGRTFSPEHRAKICAALKGKPKAPEVVAARFGRKQTPEHVANRTDALMGHVVSAETRAKISAAKRGVALC